ncbi:MAG: hypothetical protein APF76_13375 [Desulfitibacter sp. BRH_c19]|nr:MAG: hypothetical protein APF76_13375 [Desulfitibacter sp. BRH_c19]
MKKQQRQGVQETVNKAQKAHRAVEELNSSTQPIELLEASKQVQEAQQNVQATESQYINQQNGTDFQLLQQAEDVLQMDQQAIEQVGHELIEKAQPPEVKTQKNREY